MIYKLPLDNPQSDIERFIRILKGEFIPTKGVVMEYLIDEQIRRKIRNILDVCMGRGRYAPGSGNSIPNYIPVKNYLIMLEEGLNWKR